MSNILLTLKIDIQKSLGHRNLNTDILTPRLFPLPVGSTPCLGYSMWVGDVLPT